MQIGLLCFLAFLVGLALSFFVTTQPFQKYSSPQEVVRNLPQNTRNLLIKINYFRKKYFLLPYEIKELHATLFSHEQALKSEQEFKEALIKQTLDDKAYIVVSLSDNILYLKQKDKILRKVRVATGRNKLEILKGHTYYFFTPRTIFTVQRKGENPIWIMPDWAFHEKGQDPPQDINRRLVPGMLGDYALYLERGYMIHGTISSSDLGKYVTHGCIRVGKIDLKALYESVPVGTKVYIY
ncbi:MAG: L,D-transpeptidase [Candidatus Margulisbacteria bacterium]|nr:L,D-transpeptidase [Candidatus Margulisiibacteriota bacterium]